MPLPRIIAMTCKEKVPLLDGNFLLSFWVKTTEDVGLGGYLRAVVAAAVAADFAVETEYTWTATVGD